MTQPLSEPVDDDAARADRPHSCYLLEFSVGPGGARLGDVYAGTTLDALRDTVRERWTSDHLDDYLVIWYGAVLHLWVVQEGVIVEGVDLHPYLRTGHEGCDRTLARVLTVRDEGGERWKEIDAILDPYDFEKAPALPLLTRVLELQDRLEADSGDAAAREELDGLLEAAGNEQAPASYGGVTVAGLSLDWDALAAVLPPLRAPLLTAGRAAVRWARPDLRHPESYLHVYLDPAEPESLRLGVNDLENGDED